MNPGELTLREELVHGDENDGDSDGEVERQRVAEERRRHDTGENGGHGGRVFLQDGVRVLEEEGGEDTLQRVVHHQQHRHLHARAISDVSAMTLWYFTYKRAKSYASTLFVIRSCMVADGRLKEQYLACCIGNRHHGGCNNHSIPSLQRTVLHAFIIHNPRKCIFRTPNDRGEKQLLYVITT